MKNNAQVYLYIFNDVLWSRLWLMGYHGMSSITFVENKGTSPCRSVALLEVWCVNKSGTNLGQFSLHRKQGFLFDFFPILSYQKFGKISSIYNNTKNPKKFQYFCPKNDIMFWKKNHWSQTSLIYIYIYIYTLNIIWRVFTSLPFSHTPLVSS
jgi:hypothetical protein